MSSAKIFQHDIIGRKILLDKLFMTSVFDSVCHDFHYKAGMLSFNILSDEQLLEMNKKHLGHDYLTDIITFPEYKGEIVMGEVFISLDRAIENALLFGVSLDHEMSRLFIHGVLHLCGQDDYSEEDRLEMQRLEDKYLTLHFVSRGTI